MFVYEQVVADKLAASTEKICQEFPTVPIVLCHAVLDRHDRKPFREVSSRYRALAADQADLPSPTAHTCHLGISVDAQSSASVTSAPGL